MTSLGSRTTARDLDVERTLVAFTLPHSGHAGIPGAPDNSCARCNAERAFERIVARCVAAEEALRRRDEVLRWIAGNTTEAHIHHSAAAVVSPEPEEPQ